MLRLMVVGCGVRGGQWARIIKENPRCTVSAYVDVNPETLKKVKKQCGDEEVPGYTNLDEALKNVDADGVVLATPPQFHYEQSMAVLGKDLHLLAEKPLTEDFKTSLEITKLADRKGLILIVGMQFRYMPVSLAYRELIQGLHFGRPNFAQFSYIRTRDPMNYGGRVLNQYCNDMAHTFLLEQAIHHLDLVRFVYSTDVDWVQAYEWNPKEWLHNPYKQDPNVSVLLALGNGMHVNYMGTWISGNVGINQGIDFRWRTDCEKGMIIQPHLFGEKGLNIASYDAHETTHVDTGPVTPFVTDTKRLLEEYCDCWEKKKEPDTSGKDHLKTLSTILACIESSLTGTRIHLNEFQKKLEFPEEWL